MLVNEKLANAIDNDRNWKFESIKSINSIND